MTHVAVYDMKTVALIVTYNKLTFVGGITTTFGPLSYILFYIKQLLANNTYLLL